VSIDEMTGIQALQRMAPDLPMRPGKVARREFEYIRDTGRQADLRARGDRDYGAARPLARWRTTSTSKAPLSIRRCPVARVISTWPTLLTLTGSDNAK
jgi:hypothetical protein